MKMMYHIALLAGWLLTMPALVAAQNDEAAIRDGNKLYKQRQFEKALPEYQKAVQQNPKNAIARYNMGNARFRTGNFTEAEKSFDEAVTATPDSAFKQKSYYNKGVSQIKQQKLKESIEAWKNALKLNPADEDARFNLQKALTELRKQNESQDQKQPQQKKPNPQQKKQQNKLDKRKIEQYLKSLQQKEQEVQQKMQQNRSRSVTQPDKDW